MLEFNHDHVPRDSETAEWARRLVLYLHSGNPTMLPHGVTYFGIRHHSDDCPLGEPPCSWDNEKPQNGVAAKAFWENKKFVAHAARCHADLLNAVRKLLPRGWRDGTMDHMPGVKIAREALAKAKSP